MWRRSCLFIVAVTALAVTAACGSNASKSISSVSAAVTDAQLKNALLTHFKQAHTLPSATDGKKGPSLPVVLAPSRANDAIAQQAGAGDAPVSAPRCRLWAGGLWSEAVHTPALASTAKAAITSLYGLYAMPRSKSSSDLPLMSISEVILAAPPSAIPHLIGGVMPRECRQLRIYVQPMTGLPRRWVSARGYSVVTPPVGKSSHAEHGIEEIGPVPRQIWTEWFRLKNYVVEIGITAGKGVKFPSTLVELAQAAYDKAKAALP
jgi:hypothetical protein